MPNAVIRVPDSLWNHVNVKATLFGVDVFPEHPTGDITTVELTGSWDKLNSLVKLVRRPIVDGRRVALITVAEKLPITEV